MLTLKQIYDDKDAIIAGLEKKHFNNAHDAIEGVIAIDQARKAAQQKKDAASAQMNQLSKSIGQLMAKGEREQAEQVKAQTAQLKEDIKTFEAEMAAAEEKQLQALLQIPNVPYSLVPEGSGAEDNLAVKVGGWKFGQPLQCLDQEPEKAFSAEGAAIALKDWPESENPQQAFAKLPHWELAKK